MPLRLTPKEGFLLGVSRLTCPLPLEHSGILGLQADRASTGQPKSQLSFTRHADAKPSHHSSIEAESIRGSRRVRKRHVAGLRKQPSDSTTGNLGANAAAAVGTCGPDHSHDQQFRACGLEPGDGGATHAMLKDDFTEMTMQNSEINVN